MKAGAKNSVTKTFFAYLDDWYYLEFSQVSHGTLPGLTQTAGALRERAKGQSTRLEVQRDYNLMRVMIILITMYSEIEGKIKIGIIGDLIYVWGNAQDALPLYSRSI